MKFVKVYDLNNSPFLVNVERIDAIQEGYEQYYIFFGGESISVDNKNAQKIFDAIGMNFRGPIGEVGGKSSC